MTWREIAGDQNLRLVQLLQQRQGELNDAQAKLGKIRQVWREHMDCDTNCDVLLLIGEVLDGDE